MKNIFKRYGGWIFAAAISAGNITYTSVMTPEQRLAAKVAIETIIKPIIEEIKNEKVTTD